jgi:hypothetical protein
LFGGREFEQLARFAGEYAETGRDILELVEDGSLEIALYLPQYQANQWAIGDVVHVRVEPHTNTIPCVVQRVGDQLQAAPAVIQRYYRSQEHLIPVYLQPKESGVNDGGLRLGSEVRLPFAWWGNR